MIRQLIASAAVLLACSFVSGCATVNSMALDKQNKAIDTKEKSIVLMTIDVSRADGSRFVPQPFVVKLETPGAKSKEERQNFKFSKKVDAVQENDHDLYLVSMALSAGDYKLGEVVGSASAFPINSFFSVPLASKITVKPNTVTYIGRVTAKLRDRVGDEFRAGPLLPLIDQSVSGMSGSTWDVAIENKAPQDLAQFQKAFPALQNIPIDVTALAPFDRAAAQRQWDGESNGAAKPVATAEASIPGAAH
jgi:hypothetical protein